MNWKFWKKNNNVLEFSDLVEGTGNYGILKEDIIDEFIGESRYSNPYYIEFKEIDRATGNDERYDLIKIKILKIERTSSKNNSKELKRAYESIKNKTWFVCNEKNVWWFSDNQSKRRDKDLSELIKNEK